MNSARGARNRKTLTRQATSGHETDPMKLDMRKTTNKKKESKNCFQCRKVRHICYNCFFTEEESTFLSLELGNRQGLRMVEAQAKEDK